jgi:hypothetical protein
MERKRLKNWEGYKIVAGNDTRYFPRFEEPAMRAEIIPEREAESLNRLLNS